MNEDSNFKNPMKRTVRAMFAVNKGLLSA